MFKCKIKTGHSYAILVVATYPSVHTIFCSFFLSRAANNILRNSGRGGSSISSAAAQSEMGQTERLASYMCAVEVIFLRMASSLLA